MPAVPVRRLVLVVEDEAGIREVLAFVLADEGYEVECAGGGREPPRRRGLLRILRRAAQARQEPAAAQADGG